MARSLNLHQLWGGLGQEAVKTLVLLPLALTGSYLCFQDGKSPRVASLLQHSTVTALMARRTVTQVWQPRARFG